MMLVMEMKGAVKKNLSAILKFITADCGDAEVPPGEVTVCDHGDEVSLSAILKFITMKTRKFLQGEAYYAIMEMK